MQAIPNLSHTRNIYNTPNPVPSSDLETSVKTRVDVSYILEIIVDKQPEEIIGRRISSSGTLRSARELYSIYDLPGSIPNYSTYAYLPLARIAKVLSPPRNASPLLA
jgi:hypothetical protein